jgi:peptidoglycan hydrolase CwlO-like protein
MKHDYERQAALLREINEANKEKLRISRQISALLDKLAEVSAKCGELSAQLDQAEASKN